MNTLRIYQHALLSMTLFLGSCGLLNDSASKKPSNTGLIATPVTYYSTSRARYLGTKYKDNVDRLVERIVRNSKTASLQFANNISSVGGIGFFTHSATKTADERYLEVVLAVPETFETKGAHSDKVSRLFSSYGSELLAILNGESDIYQDKELTGYGLNLAWRNIITEPAGNRVTLERAIVYLTKEKTRNFLRREINQNDLLADATIFTVEEDGPLNLVSYRAPEVHQEFRPAIREYDIPPAPAAAKLSPALKIDPADQDKKEVIPVREPVAKVAPPKPPVAVAQNPKPLSSRLPVISETPAKPAALTAVNAAPVEVPLVEAVPVEVAKLAVPAPLIAPAAESKEIATVVTPVVKSVESVRAALDAPKPVVAPKIAPPAPVEVAPPAAVAMVPREVPAPAPPAIQVKPSESAAPARVVHAPKPPPMELKPFLPPPVATYVPAPEPPKVERPEPPPPVAMPEAKTPLEIVSVPPVAVRPEPLQAPFETNLPVPAQSVARNAPPVIEPTIRPEPLTPTPAIEKTAAKPGAGQLALLSNKPIEATPVRPAIARAAPKPLEGFIIQLAFNDRERAQRWAEGMEKKGFAVSLTEAGAEGALRVRLGNFVLRDDAERQLKSIKQEGLNGIILNLPQAFRPEARTSIP
jgi:hypothetical protein